MLDLDLHERVLVILVEIARTECHLRLTKDSLLLLCRARAHLMVLYEEVSVLIFSMAIINFLLQALHRLLIRPLADSHEIAGVGHAMVARLPRAHRLRGDLVEVVLRHAAHIHRGHRVILFVDEVLRLLRCVQVVGGIGASVLVQAPRVVIVDARSVLLPVLFGG